MMATAASAAESEWEIQCAYCFSPEAEMNNPRRLPCGHVNCLKGIEDDMAANQSMLRCPKCRKVFDTNPAELKAHQPGFNVVSGQMCEACSHGNTITQAIVYCVTCPSKMCEEHEKQHEELLPMHRNVMGIADFVLQQRKVTPRYCPKHSHQYLTLACENCLHRFCTDCDDLSATCIIANEKCHTISNINKLSGLLRDELNEIKSKSMAKDASFQDFSKGCAETLKAYDEETKSMRTAIKTTQNEQVEALTLKYTDLDQEFTMQRQRKRNEIAKFVEMEVDGAHRTLCDNMQLLDTTTQDLHQVDLIESYGKRKATMDRLLSEPIPSKVFRGIAKLEPCENCCDIELHLDHSVGLTITNTVLEPISQNDIVEAPTEQLAEARPDEAQLKDRNEAYLYIDIYVVLENLFHLHRGHDLFNKAKSMAALRTFKVRREDTVLQLLEMMTVALNYKPGQIRIWPFQMRQNETFRPTMLELPRAEYDHKTVQEASDGETPWYIFVETLPIGSPLYRSLPSFDRTGHVCLFIKRYDPTSETLAYCGHYYFSTYIVMNDMMPILAEVAEFPAGTKLAMYEEVKPNLIEKVEFTGGVLEKEMVELMDGDIFIVQKEESSYEGYKKPTPKEYSRELHYQVEVMFYDKSEPTDAGFTLDLSLRMNYNTIATQVAEHLGSDPYMLQFFRSHGYKEGPDQNALKCGEGLLKDFVSRSSRKLYYQKLSIPITELENKRQLKCMWVTHKVKEEKELVLHPNKNGNVQELLDEARKQVDLNPAGSKKLRLLEVARFKIVNILPNDMALESLMQQGNKSLRIEEIPQDETCLSESEMLIPVAHFHQEIYALFGVPFLIRLQDGEQFSSLRERIRKKIDISEKEYEKFRFAVIMMGRKTYIEKEEEHVMKLSDFKPSQTVGHLSSKPWLGLDHLNKAPKRGRYSYLEKAIKIHN